MSGPSPPVPGVAQVRWLLAIGSSAVFLTARRSAASDPLVIGAELGVEPIRTPAAAIASARRVTLDRRA